VLTALGWLISGAHVSVLATALGAGPRDAAMAAAAYCLSTVAGMLMVVVPAGLGGRELVLGLALGSALPGTAALTVVALSRLLVTSADLAAAVGAAAYAAARHRAANHQHDDAAASAEATEPGGSLYRSCGHPARVTS
jgi:uncharacterized membrane protein YbhN (UPF0104 family)